MITIPHSVAVCPICGADLQPPEIEELETDDAGELVLAESGMKVNCSTEPDIDSPDWREWHNWHWRTPYVDWLPVEMVVERWVRKTFVFDADWNGHRREAIND